MYFGHAEFRAECYEFILEFNYWLLNILYTFKYAVKKNF